MIFDGKEYARLMIEQLKAKIDLEKIVPRLVWICVGEDEASNLYGKLKARTAMSLGIKFDTVMMNVGISQSELGVKLKEFCTDKSIHGVMVQLPAKIDGNLFAALSEITAEKDVDCLNPYSMGMLMANYGIYLPATVAAVGQIVLFAIGETKVPVEINLLLVPKRVLAGKRAVVVGGGWEIGKPLVGLLSNWGATVLWARSSEQNLEEVIKLGDIVVSATGRENLITGVMIKEGAIVIDVGSPNGDIDFGSVSTMADFLTPVPGGVGPLTVACLMANVVWSAIKCKA